MSENKELVASVKKAYQQSVGDLSNNTPKANLYRTSQCQTGNAHRELMKDYGPVEGYSVVGMYCANVYEAGYRDGALLTHFKSKILNGEVKGRQQLIKYAKTIADVVFSNSQIKDESTNVQLNVGDVDVRLDDQSAFMIGFIAARAGEFSKAGKFDEKYPAGVALMLTREAHTHDGFHLSNTITEDHNVQVRSALIAGALSGSHARDKYGEKGNGDLPLFENAPDMPDVIGQLTAPSFPYPVRNRIAVQSKAA